MSSSPYNGHPMDFDASVFPTPHQPHLALAVLLSNLALNNSANNEDNDSNPFHCPVSAPVPLDAYAARLGEYLYASPESFVIASCLVTKVKPLIHANSVHRVLLAVCVLASKIHDDIHPPDDHLAFVGGVSVAELADLQIAMMRELNFTLVVTPSEFDKAARILSFLRRTTTGESEQLAQQQSDDGYWYDEEEEEQAPYMVNKQHHQQRQQHDKSQSPSPPLLSPHATPQPQEANWSPTQVPCLAPRASLESSLESSFDNLELTTTTTTTTVPATTTKTRSLWADQPSSPSLVLTTAIDFNCE